MFVSVNGENINFMGDGKGKGLIANLIIVARWVFHDFH